ncbi:MAG: galactose mutarotase [Coprobacillus sp.]|nr:galactose mutarotase [Coprobacillus sp.]
MKSKPIKVTYTPFLKGIDGETTYLYRITNSKGAYIELTNLGATITSIVVPDRNGKLTDVTLSYSNREGFLESDCYFGASVGRVAGRIAYGHFTLNNKEYNLAINNGVNHLHGGVRSFSRRTWNAKVTPKGVKMSLISPSGEEGYPGTLSVDISFSFDDSNSLLIDYRAVSDEDTLVNLTNHTYFSLSGEATNSILDNQLKIDASSYIEVDPNMIPTVSKSVVDTPFDFRKFKEIGKDIAADNAQFHIAQGYDHSFILNESKTAYAYSPKTGIYLTCTTDYPILHIYTSNFVSVKNGKHNHSYGRYSGFCFETQLYNDAVNHPEWPQYTLHKGELYHHFTRFSFTTK